MTVYKARPPALLVHLTPAFAKPRIIQSFATCTSPTSFATVFTARLPVYAASFTQKAAHGASEPCIVSGGRWPPQSRGIVEAGAERRRATVTRSAPTATRTRGAVCATPTPPAPGDAWLLGRTASARRP